jgi:hypothetical protein
MKIIAPTISVYENAFPKPDAFIEKLELLIDSDISLNWIWARTSGNNSIENKQDGYRTNKEFPITSNCSNPLVKELDSFVFESITKFIGEYAAQYDIGSLNDEGYTVLKYQDGMEYRKHHDCGGPHDKRVVSILVYLNDGYVGGQLEFPHLGVTYTPKSGDLVLFPSNYTFAHIAHPVTEGTKYAIVSWMSCGE